MNKKAEEDIFRETYINHGIRGDAEQCGSLCHLANLVPGLSSQTQTVQF